MSDDANHQTPPPPRGGSGGGAVRLPVQRVRVSAAWAGSRLDRLLGHLLPGVPPSALRRFLRTGQVRLNGGRAKGGERLVQGDEVRIPPVTVDPPPPAAGPPVPPGAVALLERRILWRDDTLLVLNKPPGMVVHSGSGQPWGVVDALRLLLGTGGDEGPELVHRLDRETSGCLVVGLERAAVRELARAFRVGEVEKHYLALVQGVPHPRRGRIELALEKGRLRGGERMVAAGAEGAAAVTEYRVERVVGGCALLAIRLLTGRTHQIRAHFQHLGHPLAGDGKYGDPQFNRRLRAMGLKRLFLHARRVELRHPRSGAPLAVEAPLEPELIALLERLAGGEAGNGMGG